MAAMGVAAQTQLQLEKRVLEGFASKSMELKWVSPRISKSSQLQNKKPLRPIFPIYISTDPRHVDPHRLRDLFADCNYSTQRFPTRPGPGPEPVDIHKLRIALSHSAVVVSVFCNLRHVNAVVPYHDNSSSLIADFLTPVSPSRDQLVGFGRAVSDYGLTASIYDVVVIKKCE